MEEKIVSVINEMTEVLNVHQLKKLQESLLKNFSDNTFDKTDISNELYLSLFLSAKQIEGCSERTVKYYSDTIHNFIKTIDGPVRKMTTEAIREYLVNYQKARDCSRITIDNIRRNISSFFTWLEEEDYSLPPLETQYDFQNFVNQVDKSKFSNQINYKKYPYINKQENRK